MAAMSAAAKTTTTAPSSSASPVSATERFSVDLQLPGSAWLTVAYQSSQEAAIALANQIGGLLQLQRDSTLSRFAKQIPAAAWQWLSSYPITMRAYDRALSKTWTLTPRKPIVVTSNVFRSPAAGVHSTTWVKFKAGGVQLFEPSHAIAATIECSGALAQSDKYRADLRGSLDNALRARFGSLVSELWVFDDASGFTNIKTPLPSGKAAGRFYVGIVTGDKPTRLDLSQFKLQVTGLDVPRGFFTDSAVSCAWSAVWSRQVVDPSVTH